LRKEPSIGLLLPLPLRFGGPKEGDDLAKHFGVLHYNPPIPKAANKRGRITKKPKTPCPFYDLDSLRRYSEVLSPEEPVFISEKLHGMNSAYLFEPLPPIHWGWARFEKQFFLRLGQREFRLGKKWPFFTTLSLPWEAVNIRVRSRTVWRLWNPKDPFWKALTKEMIALVTSSPGLVLFGEVIGPLAEHPGFTYGITSEEGCKFLAFDTYDSKAQRYYSPRVFQSICRMFGVPTVPFFNPETRAFAHNPVVQRRNPTCERGSGGQT
jgi:hypothetical protein